MLFEAKGANDYLSAAILDPETLYQRSTSAGNQLFPDRLKEVRGIGSRHRAQGAGHRWEVCGLE